jgi:DNA-nicking Smr family endonuclease
MAQRNNSAQPSKPKPGAAKQNPPPPSPFREALQPLKQQLVQQAEAQRKVEAEQRRNPPPPPPEPEPSPLSEEELLAIALAGVRPLSGPARVAPKPPAPQKVVADSKDKLKGIQGLASDQEPDEPDWWSGDVDPSFLWMMGGDRPYQRALDLHGKVVEAAARDMEAAVHSARQQKQACILVIHGKGLRSAGEPRLGSAVRELLRGKLKRLVLGYSTARPEHGGTGALYVWVRPLV